MEKYVNEYNTIQYKTLYSAQGRQQIEGAAWLCSIGGRKQHVCQA